MPATRHTDKYYNTLFSFFSPAVVQLIQNWWFAMAMAKSYRISWVPAQITGWLAFQRWHGALRPWSNKAKPRQKSIKLQNSNRLGSVWAAVNRYVVQTSISSSNIRNVYSCNVFLHCRLRPIKHWKLNFVKNSRTYRRHILYAVTQLAAYSQHHHWAAWCWSLAPVRMRCYAIQMALHMAAAAGAAFWPTNQVVIISSTVTWHVYSINPLPQLPTLQPGGYLTVPSKRYSTTWMAWSSANMTQRPYGISSNRISRWKLNTICSIIAMLISIKPFLLVCVPICQNWLLMVIAYRCHCSKRLAAIWPNSPHPSCQKSILSWSWTTVSTSFVLVQSSKVGIYWKMASSMRSAKLIWNLASIWFNWPHQWLWAPFMWLPIQFNTICHAIMHTILKYSTIIQNQSRQPSMQIILTDFYRTHLPMEYQQMATVPIIDPKFYSFFSLFFFFNYFTLIFLFYFFIWITKIFSKTKWYFNMNINNIRLRYIYKLYIYGKNFFLHILQNI